MNVDEVIGWIDPLDEYKLQAPTCIIDDFACWEFEDMNTVHLHMPQHGTFKLIAFTGGSIDVVITSDDIMYILNTCRDLIAEQQYNGEWYG